MLPSGAVGGRDVVVDDAPAGQNRRAHVSEHGAVPTTTTGASGVRRTRRQDAADAWAARVETWAGTAQAAPKRPSDELRIVSDEAVAAGDATGPDGNVARRLVA